jgi:hypothetical protein
LRGILKHDNPARHALAQSLQPPPSRPMMLGIEIRKIAPSQRAIEVLSLV